MSAKIEEGDFKHAIILATSDDQVALENATSFADLLQNIQVCTLKLCFQTLASDPPPSVPVTSDEIVRAIQSFPCGSAGGPDGLRPQHLKVMVSLSTHSGGTILVEALQSMISLILSGQPPLSIRPFFFGAFLIALEKKGGGIRPIAVGCTLCRLAAKVVSGKVMVEMATLLSPCQLGYGAS